MFSFKSGLSSTNVKSFFLHWQLRLYMFAMIKIVFWMLIVKKYCSEATTLLNIYILEWREHSIAAMKEKLPLQFKFARRRRHWLDGGIQIHRLCGCVWLLLKQCIGLIAYTHTVDGVIMHRHTRCVCDLAATDCSGSSSYSYIKNIQHGPN